MDIGRPTRFLTAFAVGLTAFTVSVLTAAPTAGAVETGSVDVSFYSTCAVMADSTVQCWGTASSGLLGNGVDDGTIFAPTTVPGVVGAQQVSIGDEHACALLADETITCWGRNTEGQVQPSTAGPGVELPQTVAGVAGVDRLVVGGYYTCVILTSGSLSCWGSNDSGQLGVDPATDPVTAPTPVAGLAGVVSVDGLYDHTSAVESDGDVWCWGANDEGQLGDGTIDESSTPVLVGLSAPAIQVTAGDQFSCALITGGAVECWGTNNDGQLGDGTTDDSLDPVPVTGLGGTAVEIAAGRNAVCARLNDGTVECWGQSESGRLGNGVDAEIQQSTPVAVSGLTDAAHLAGSNDHFCAITTSDGLVCWGDGRRGQLAVGPPVSVTRAQLVQAGSFPEVSVGRDFTCVRSGAGAVACVGANTFGQLGDGTITRNDTLTSVTGVTDAADLDAGADFACIARTDGTASCWGRGSVGRLGNGSNADQASPVAVSSLTDVTHISAGGGHTCARTNGTVDKQFWCWGLGSGGQRGDGTNSSSESTPQLVLGVGDGLRISAGGDHSCGIVSAGAIRCWGWNAFEQLGDGTDVASNVPIAAASGTAADQVSAGERHNCARAIDGSVVCWGADFDGELGNGPGADSSPGPMVDIGPAGHAALAVAAGQTHTCVVLDDETVACTGDNADGRLGDGTTTDRDQITDGTGEPVRVIDENGDPLNGIVSIDAWDHTCAVRKPAAGGGLFCWGLNHAGPWGDPPFQATPVVVPLSMTVGATTTTTTTTVPGGATTTTTTVPSGPPPSADLFTSVAPARLLDTRPAPAGQTIDGLQSGIGRLADGGEVTIDIGGRADVPDDAAAAVINITAIRPGGVGFVTSHPCLPEPPTTSSLNFTAGVSLGNEVIVELDDDGNACLFTSTATDLAVDIVAYLPAGAPYTPVGPARLADTRPAPAGQSIDDDFVGRGPLGDGNTYEIQVTGRAGIPADAAAAVVNVTAIAATGIGFFTIHPCLSTPPNAAGLNYTPGANRGNEIIAPLSADGSLCVFTSTTTGLAVDVVGFIDASAYTPVEPARFLDTRQAPNISTADGQAEGIGRLVAGETTPVQIAGRVDIPDDAATVTVNVTAIGGAGVGFVTVHPCLPDAPNAASLNFVAGVNGGNEIVAQLDDNGRICVFVSTDVDLTIDIAGYTT